MPTVFQANTYPNSGAITIGLASLTTTSADPPVGRESTEVLNTSDLGLDAWIDGKITTGTSPTASRRIRIWAWAGGYDGSNVRRPAGATGADAGLTPPGNYVTAWRLLHWIDTSSTSNVTYTFAGLSLLAVFGGLILPPRWGLFVDHNTGVNLHATAGNHELRYTIGKAQGA